MILYIASKSFLSDFLAKFTILLIINKMFVDIYIFLFIL